MFTNPPTCPCGWPKSYAECCGLYHSGAQSAPTPEALMRSRYTAFTKADMDYIIKTMKPPISEKFNADETRAWTLANKWLRLEIIKSSSAGNKGYVEFKAHFSRQDKPDLIHENSEFRRDNEQWFYINGEGPKMRSSVTDIKTANIRSTP